MRSGPLRRAIGAYKYGGKWGWGGIFARVLVGYLSGMESVFREYDQIIPMPTYTGEGGRRFDHTRYVVERAQIEGPGWPWRLGLIEKTAWTPPLAAADSFQARAQIAETQMRSALRVVDPEHVGDRVLVFDDVFTGGLTLREVAYKLKDAGATRVSGIVLARQPFRS
jgi:predicted amidophosphoribosyltransferase